ncbi:MAG TPA: TlpA disulfide reductase family protein [Bacillota bacterium]|nr:TlpA disulfide reductase family protein [Bacillota bacterium]
MRKIVLVLVIVGIVGMLGWTVYEFASSSDNGGNDDMVGNGNMITSPPPNPEDIEESDEVGTELGQMAPDFELETLEEDTVVRLSDLQGERVIVNFWATWCAPCREEIPDFQKLYDSEDVEILAVNMTESEKSEDDVIEFVDEFAMTFPVLLDVDSEVSETYQVQAYPTTYMIDSNGHIQYIAMGPMDYDLMAEQLEKME